MITAAILISSICISFAQEKTSTDNRERKTPEERAQLMTNGLEKKLALSADQKAKVYQINLERAQKMNEFQSSNSNTEDRKKQMEVRKELMEESDRKLVEVLTEDQKKTYQELKDENKAKLKEQRGDKKGRDNRDHSENSSN
ncbi:MAG: hypothetical protein JWN56_1176 [Sphingobacteriales bacterium]|nr:hypothetical protein [Sphingobacteriales bacterium]